MHTFFRVLSWAAFGVGVFGILWPLPGFLLSKEAGEAYLRFLWRLPENDRSAGAALPFVWMFFTAPAGLFFIAATLLFDRMVDWMLGSK